MSLGGNINEVEEDCIAMVIVLGLEMFIAVIVVIVENNGVENGSLRVVVFVVGIAD